MREETPESIAAACRAVDKLITDVHALKTSNPVLRDQFAIATLKGLWSSPDMEGILAAVYNHPSGGEREQAMTMMAEIAYQQADVMMKVRDAGRGI